MSAKLSRKHSVLVAGAALYGLVALVTFGRSAAQESAWHDGHCRTPEERLVVGDRCYQPLTMSAVGAGLLWPLYWSWELQS